MQRIPLYKDDFLKGKFSLNKKYVLKNKLFKNESCLENLSLDSKFTFLDKFSKINILCGSITLLNVVSLKIISENIDNVGDIVFIRKCPLLKTIPLKITFGKDIVFCEDQFLTTIFSQEQFQSLKSLSIQTSCDLKTIHSYQEYSSLTENTLNKNELLKVCTL